MPRSILPEYGIREEMMQVTAFGNGLINRTWKINLPGRSYILQKINQQVFKDPVAIAHNIRVVADFRKSLTASFALTISRGTNRLPSALL